MSGERLPNIEKALLKSIGLNDLANVIGDSAEAAIDAALSGGLLKEIPVIASLVGLAKTGLAIRDRIFLKKLLRFLRTAAEVPDDERDAFIDKISTDEPFRRKVGETLIVVLDRLDHLDKAELVARVFNGYVQGAVDFPAFERLATAIDRAFMEDLTSLLRYCSGEVEWPQENLWQRLYPSGLSHFDVNVTVEHEFMNVLRAKSFHPLAYSPTSDAFLLARLVLRERLDRHFLNR